MEQKEQRLIETDTINAVLKYLSQKPYVEVMQIVPMLVNLPIAPPQKSDLDTVKYDTEQK